MSVPSSIPAFIDLSENEQILELRGYLKSKGGAISESNAEAGLIADLQQVIHATVVLWKEGVTDQELESVFNSIISLVLIVPADKNDGLIAALSEQLSIQSTADRHAAARIRLLWNLFHGLDKFSVHRYNVFLSILKIARNSDLLQLVNPKLDQIKKWLATWNVSAARAQLLLRTLHEALIAAKSSELATKVMIELLSTYTTENAPQARDDALRCIVTCLSDPNTFLLDHLLVLKPVKFLEGELIHELLTLFVSGKLLQYVQFYQTHKDFVTSIGLNHDDNTHKMRLLTFMQMAEGAQEISFDTIQQELQLPQDQIEAFIIDVVRTQTVRCKIDQLAGCVHVTSTTHRTFGRQQWQHLRDAMGGWQAQLNQVLASLQAVTR